MSGDGRGEGKLVAVLLYYAAYIGLFAGLASWNHTLGRHLWVGVDAFLVAYGFIQATSYVCCAPARAKEEEKDGTA